MADKYDDLFSLACCVQSQVLELIDEDPILQTPKYGGITHAGEGFCCDSLWITVDPTVLDPAIQPGQDKCASSVTERIRIIWGIPACSERLFFEDCDEDLEPCVTVDGCPEPSHAIGDGKCGQSTPSVQDESAYIWRARSLLRRELGCRVQCCADGSNGQCVPVRCHSIKIAEITQNTEGACAYLEFVLEAKL